MQIDIPNYLSKLLAKKHPIEEVEYAVWEMLCKTGREVKTMNTVFVPEWNAIAHPSLLEEDKDSLIVFLAHRFGIPLFGIFEAKIAAEDLTQIENKPKSCNRDGITIGPIVDLRYDGLYTIATVDPK
jgi:hypothetical protein